MTRSDPLRGSRRAQRGVALVLVLWLTVMLTVIGGTLAYAMRSEALAARNAVSLAQARAVADGAVDRAAFELLRPRTQEAWKADGRPREWSDAGAQVTVVAVDENARIDLNGASEVLLRSLFVRQGGLDEAAAAALVDAMADWRDDDELRRPNGAEATDYRAANSKYVPTNRRFETVGEVSRVLGMTPAVYARIAGLVTVHTNQQGINPHTASREVLLALPNATPEAVDEFLQQRADAIAANLPVPPFPAAQGFAAGASAMWRIRAEVRAADGVTFVREAVVRATPDPRRPYVALLWGEADRPAPPAATADAAAAPVPAAKPDSGAPTDARRS
jgi:general secretion pathway protein K